MTERQRLVQAAKKSKRLDEQASQARREMWDAMAKARASGMTLDQIAKIAELSRQRVMTILRGSYN